MERIELALQKWSRFWAAIGKPINQRSATPRGRFLDLVDDHIKESDLQDAAWELGIDYESLPGDGKHDKARELAIAMRREARTYQLIDWLNKNHPHVDWPTLDTGPLG